MAAAAEVLQHVNGEAEFNLPHSLRVAATVPWLERALSLPGLRLTPLAVAAAISSSFLTEPFPGDPADRLLVASARTLPATLITRDARVLSYAAAGHLRAVAC